MFRKGKNTGIPHCDLIRSILRWFSNANAKLVSWNWLWGTSTSCC